MRLRWISAVAMLAIALPLTSCMRNADQSAQMRELVRADIAAVMRDIDHAESVNPAVALSSNPFDYAAVSPSLDRLVARGSPALDAIAEEIEKSPESGLREYLLAVAGQRILGSEEIPAGWSTGKEWARLCRASQ